MQYVIEVEKSLAKRIEELDDDLILNPKVFPRSNKGIQLYLSCLRLKSKNL